MSHAPKIKADELQSKLLAAIISEDLEAARAALAAGAKVDHADEDGIQAIHLAAQRKSLKAWLMFTLLVNAGASVRAVNKLGGTPLHYAAQGGDTNIIKYLLGMKAKIDATTSDGSQPLHIAAIFSREAYELLVVKYGARTDVPDIWGKTPAMLFARYHKIEPRDAEKMAVVFLDAVTLAAQLQAQKQRDCHWVLKVKDSD